MTKFRQLFPLIFGIIAIIIIWQFFLSPDVKCKFIYGKNICNFYSVIEMAGEDPLLLDFEKMVGLCKEMDDFSSKDECFEFVATTFSEIDINKAKEACDYIKGFDDIRSKDSCYYLITKLSFLSDLTSPWPKLSYNIGGCQDKQEREFLKTRSRSEKIDIEIVDDQVNLIHHLNYVCCAKIKAYLEPLESYPEYTLIKIKEKNEGEMCRCVCDYKIDIQLGPLEKGKYLLRVLGVEFGDSPAELLWEKELEITKRKYQKEEKICEDLCGDGICQELVCLGTGCPCVESSESCPQDCK